MRTIHRRVPSCGFSNHPNDCPECRMIAARWREWSAGVDGSDRLGPSVRPQPRADRGRPFVEAQETTPPEGEEPLHWLLLTTLTVTDYADCVRILPFYS